MKYEDLVMLRVGCALIQMDAEPAQTGICSIFTDFSYHTYYSPVAIKDALKCAFKLKGLDTVYPFNIGKDDHYADEKITKSIWENEKRIAFVKEYADALTLEDLNYFNQNLMKSWHCIPNLNHLRNSLSKHK